MNAIFNISNLRKIIGTESLVAPNRDKDDSTLGFKEWTFSTVRCWGESPVGTFALYIKDHGDLNDGNGFIFLFYKLVLTFK